MGFQDLAPPDPLRTAWLDCSDWGNAQRLVEIAQGTLLWIVDLEYWARYDGRRWALDRGDIEATRMAHLVIAHVDKEVAALAEVADDAVKLAEALGWNCPVEAAQARVEALRKHAVRSGSAGMTSGMLRQARSFLAAQSDEFDRDPLVYNVMNATLRFTEHKGRWKVEAKPHDPADRLMQVANVEYDPAAKCPFWNERLAMLTPDPQQLAAFKPLYGYTLTGLTSDQAFYVHQGKGGDGKSMTNMALADLHGDYYRHASVKTFLQGKDGGGAEHRSDLVRLRGDVRFVTCDEPKPRTVWDGEIIKQFTGSHVTARGAHERTEVTFRPRGKLHVECNVIPRAPSDDRGFRRRFKLYQWTVVIAETSQGEMPEDVVLAKLQAEKPGILNWLIEGACEWLMTRRIPQPEAMASVLEDFWADSSPLLTWIDERCDTTDPKAKGYVKELYDDFKAWCEAAGIEHVMGTTAFGRALRDKQFRVDKDGRGTRFRWGICLAPAERASFGTAEPSNPPGPSGRDESDPFRPEDW